MRRPLLLFPAVTALMLWLHAAAAQPVIDRHQTLMWEVGDLMHQWEELQAAADAAKVPSGSEA